MLSRELLRSRGRDTPRLGPTNRRPPRFHVGTFGLKSREINRKITKKKKNRKLSKAVRNYIIIAVSVLAFRDTRNHFLRHFFLRKKSAYDRIYSHVINAIGFLLQFVQSTRVTNSYDRASHISSRRSLLRLKRLVHYNPI